MSTAPTLELIRACMQQALKLDAAEAHALDMDATPATVAAWTSVAHLDLVLALERELGVMFDAEQIGNMASVRALAAAIDDARREA